MLRNLPKLTTIVITVALLSVALTILPASRSAAAPPRLRDRFHELDRNNDWELTADELKDKSVFRRLDTDSNGRIPFAEAAEAVRTGALKGVVIDSDPTPPAPSSPESTSQADISTVRRGPQRLTPGEHGVGRFVPDVTLFDVHGKSHRLSEFTAAGPTAVVMTSTSCPLSLRYLPTVAALAQQYADRNVTFLVVNSVDVDRQDDMQQAAKTLGANAVYVVDPNQELAEAVGAATTTDSILITTDQTVAFHGAVDDQYGFGYAIDAPRHRYLADAIESVLSGNTLLTPATDAPGCELSFEAAPATNADVTYHRDVERLVQRHCVECHRDGGVAPFRLTTYEDVVGHAPMIREVVERGVMPPWFAANDSQESDRSAGRWANDRSLSASEKQLLTTWISAGRPKGDAADAPKPKQFPGDWLIGTPDAVFGFRRPVRVKATGTMPYQNIRVTTDLPEDKWVQAIEVRPGNRAVVHHVIVSIRSSDSDTNGDESGREEREGFWGVYVPGNSTLSYPFGMAKRLPQGAVLNFQMHYTPNGTATEDVTEIGLVFADRPPEHEVRVAGIINTRIDIPAGADNHREIATLRVPADVQVLAFLPHMHLRGKAARYDVVSGDRTTTVLDIPRYDFNWQLLYRLAEPLNVRRGDRIRFTGWFDNSTNNPANPDAAANVRWGPQTDDEMLLGYVEYIVP
ncbi:MAG: redoxin family protein [Planctomycetaceae bacterium]|nr:redoxin family protein [Planctomycetaceae bacterium]